MDNKNIKYAIGYFELIEYEDFNENNTNKPIEDTELSPPIEEHDEYADMPELVYVDDLQDKTVNDKESGYSYFSKNESDNDIKIYSDNGNLVKDNISTIILDMLNIQNYINQSDNKKYNSENESDEEIIGEIRNLYKSKN